MDHPHPPESHPDQSAAAEQSEPTPLDQVVDDLEPKAAWGDWAIEEMTRGRSPEDLAAELAANGWSDDDAEDLVETARRRTRHLRGVITREEVARENAARYHKATALNALFGFRFISTTFLSIAFARRLLNSLAFVLHSRHRPNPAPGFPVEPAPPAQPEAPAPADAPMHDHASPPAEGE